MKQKKSKRDDNKIVKLAEGTKDVRVEMAELVERALEGAANLITLSESMTRGEKQELSKLVEVAYDKVDANLGFVLVQERKQEAAEMLFDAIDTVRRLEIDDEELTGTGVESILRLMAILDQIQEEEKAEHAAAFKLRKMARNGDVSAIRGFMIAEKGNRAVSLDSCSPGGYTALMEAAQFGQKEVVSELLAKSANVDSITKLGWSALKFAALAGDDNIEVLKLLLAKKPSLDVVSGTEDLHFYGNTVLHNASESGFVQTVEILLAAKCDPHIENADGKTPMNLAFERRYIDVVRLFDADQADSCEVQYTNET